MSRAFCQKFASVSSLYILYEKEQIVVIEQGRSPTGDEFSRRCLASLLCKLCILCKRNLKNGWSCTMCVRNEYSLFFSLFQSEYGLTEDQVAGELRRLYR